MKSDEEKLKELFEMKEEPSFDKTVYKAKMFSLIKNVVISVMILCIFMIVFLLLNATLLNKKAHKEESALENYYNIAMPNGYIGAIENDDRLMVGEIDYSRYRFLGNKIVADGEYENVFTYMPLINCKYGNVNGYLFYDGSDSDNRYNKIGRSVMKFYDPNGNYEKYDNGIERLENIDNNKLAEMSLSFDKAYSIYDVQAMLPENITLNWYWVNTFGEIEGNERIYYEEDVFGIKNIDSRGQKIYNPEESFIDTIKYYKDYDKNFYGELYESLKNKDTDKIETLDLKIIGVVVSGEVSNLKALKNESFIKASSIGAVADNY